MRFWVEWALLAVIENMFGTLLTNLAKMTREDKQNRGSLPIIVELVLIPSPFVEPSAVDGSDTIIYTCNTDFIRA